MTINTLSQALFLDHPGYQEAVTNWLKKEGLTCAEISNVYVTLVDTLYHHQINFSLWWLRCSRHGALSKMLSLVHVRIVRVLG